mmetsp:Transcript_1205/g.1894  ORF Transcript_1205/g.1894 Transcript_1205/m.1894 type:complete len:128 (-) Transcript_1205:212-595(-)
MATQGHESVPESTRFAGRANELSSRARELKEGERAVERKGTAKHTRASRFRENAVAEQRKAAIQDAKRRQAAQAKAWMEEQLRQQALRNGFDLENFSYKPDIEIARKANNGVLVPRNGPVIPPSARR